MPASRRAPLRASLALGLACLGASCVSTLDARPDRAPEGALEPDRQSRLGALFTVPTGADGAPPPSLFAPLDRAEEGLDARLALAACAHRSIDAQSYLWHEDASGSLLLDALLAAADRGVRVRLVIDGFRLEGGEELDRALALHPNLEVRAFNPQLHRSGVWSTLELVENLGRLDHRMHDKAFLVDGVVGVFGGRNVGDEYFGLGQDFDFRDFDLLASGPVVADLSRTFDEFWNSPWTVPVEELADAGRDGAATSHEGARRRLRELHAADGRLDARRARSADEWLAALARARGRMVPGRATVVHDLAALEREGATSVLAHAFERALAETRGDALIQVAYLVPDETLLECVRAHVAAGGTVRILTNSFASTNQPLAHTFYAAARDDLLDAGAELYELRADAWAHVHHRSAGGDSRRLGLHAKAAVLDDTHVLVGSLNLDPRSMVLNTELGVLVESRELATWVRTCLERELRAHNAWRVLRDEDGRLRWSTLGLERTSEPDLGAGERAREWFLRLLPIEGEV